MAIVMYESAEEILVTELSKEDVLKKSYFEVHNNQAIEQQKTNEKGK